MTEYDTIKKTLRFLVACEESQTVCSAFRDMGFECYSNDINPCYGGHPEWHIVGDAELVILAGASYKLEDGSTLPYVARWDMIIAHPPCTMITHSSAVAFSQGKHTIEDVREGARFFMAMLNAPCDHVAVENPAPMKVAGLPKYNQAIQPYQLGDPWSKRVCLWLRGLPPLMPTTGYCTEWKSWLGHCASTHRRRSKTFPSVARTMAENWGDYVVKQRMKERRENDILQ